MMVDFLATPLPWEENVFLDRVISIREQNLLANPQVFQTASDSDLPFLLFLPSPLRV
jgi:hypothetical protein